MIRRGLAVLLAGLMLAPAGAFAQASRAGVVTTLEGNVSARRVALPGPVSLKFKDDVFLQDTVTTGDKSLARMLLGGKAVVTVRERSVITITEVPGRSTLELESGKFALAVAREKMRPGEEIQIRTPNAIAGVRGTVVITEVNRQSAQAGGPAPAVLTNFYVLRGSITAQPLDPATRQPLGTPLIVGTMQAYSGAGTATPRIAPVPPEQVALITSGLQPSGPKSGGGVGSEQVKVQQVQTAIALITTLTGTTFQAQQSTVPSTIAVNGQNSTTAPLTPTTSNPAVLADPPAVSSAGQFTGVSTLTTPAQTFSASFTSASPDAILRLMNATIIQLGDFIVLASGANVSLAGPLVTFVDSALVTDGSLFQLQGGSLTSTSTNALIDLDPSIVSAGETLIDLNGGTVTLAGPLLMDVGGVIGAGDELLRLQGATLVGTSTSPLVQLTGTSVAVDSFIRLLGGSTITLAGSLASLTDAVVAASDVNRSFIAVLDGSKIVTTGTNEPLLTLAGSTITSERTFFSLAFNATTTSPSMSLSGPFLSASNTDVTIGDPTANTFPLLFIGDGAQVTSTTTSPFMTFTGSNVDTAGDVLTLRRSTAGTPSRLTLAGPLLVATNSTFNHTSLGFGTAFSTSASACCSAFFVAQGGALSSTTSQALIQLTGSTVTGNDAQSGGSFFHVADTFSGAPAAEVVAPATVSLAGPLLQSTNSTITSLFHLIRVQRSSLSSTSTSPLIDITGGSVTLGGTNAAAGGTASGNLLSLISATNPGEAAAAASVTLAGPLARLTSTSFLAGAGNVVTVSHGATLTGTGAGALLQLTGTTLTGSNLLSISGLGGPSGTTKASVSLAGPALTLSSSTATLGSNVLAVFGDATLTSTATGALLQLTGSSLTGGTSFSGAAVLQVNGGTNAGLATLNGPVFSAASSSTLSIPGALLATFNGGQLVVNGSTDPLYAFSGGTHSFGTASGIDRDAAFILNGLTTQTAAESIEVEVCPDGCQTTTVTRTLGTRQPVQASGSLIDATGGTLTTNKVVRLDTALLAATAPILNLKSGASMTVATDGVDLINQAKLSMTTAANPLIRLDGSTLTVSNGALLAVRSNSFLNIPGNAISLSGGATLTVGSGGGTGLLLLASGGGVVKINGALLAFGSGSNTVNVNNTLCPSVCANFNGVKVSFGPGASSSNVSIGSGAISGSGTINRSSPMQTADIRIEGATTIVNIAPNGGM